MNNDCRRGDANYFQVVRLRHGATGLSDMQKRYESICHKAGGAAPTTVRPEGKAVKAHNNNPQPWLWGGGTYVVAKAGAEGERVPGELVGPGILRSTSKFLRSTAAWGSRHQITQSLPMLARSPVVTDRFNRLVCIIITAAACQGWQGLGRGGALL